MTSRVLIASLMSGLAGVVFTSMSAGGGGDGSGTAAGRVAIPLALTLLSAAALGGLTVRDWSQRARRAVTVLDRWSEGTRVPPLKDDATDELGRLTERVDRLVRSLDGRIEELARDRARMEAILSGMVESVLVVDERGEVVLANEAARALLRLDAAPIGVRYVELIRHPDIAAQLAAALQGRTPGGLELTLRGDRTVITRCAPVVTSAVTGAVLVLHDVTDLKRADRVRQDFVANVSHELRTPLTAIRGYVEALREGPPDPATTERFLAIVARHSGRMERLVDDLLRLARLDGGQELLSRVPCSTERLLSTVSGDLGSIIEARHQRVEIDVAPDARTVHGDPAKLHDVLRNLIENASSYSPEATTISLAVVRPGPFVEIRVADRGPGIPPDDLRRVFERFYRVDKARSRESGGTGLGLSIVKHLVELHGGSVEAGNRSGGGAVFTVRLPASPGDDAGEDDAHARTVRSGAGDAADGA